MSTDATVRPIVLVTNETTRAELAITLEILNAEAKRISRRGKVGTHTDDYRLRHEYINSVLTDYEQAPT